MIRRFILLQALAWLAMSAAYAADVAWVWPSSDAPTGYQNLAVVLDQLLLRGNTVEIRHRMRILRPAPLVRVTPVVHVQSQRDEAVTLDASQADTIYDAVLAASHQSTSGWVQLDFEPLRREQDFYLSLVHRLKTHLAPDILLSVTVMAESCLNASFVDKIEADEVVPMFFGLGPGQQARWGALLADPKRLDARCRNASAGFAIGQGYTRDIETRYPRRYWFNYNNWNQEDRPWRY